MKQVAGDFSGQYRLFCTTSGCSDPPLMFKTQASFVKGLGARGKLVQLYLYADGQRKDGGGADFGVRREEQLGQQRERVGGDLRYKIRLVLHQPAQAEAQPLHQQWRAGRPPLSPRC